MSLPLIEDSPLMATDERVRSRNNGPQSPHDTDGRRKSGRRKRIDEDEISRLLIDLTNAVKENTQVLRGDSSQKVFSDDVKDLEQEPRRSEKVSVEVRVGYKKIIDVDTVKQLYKAEIFVQTKWPEPHLANMTDKELSTVNFEKLWRPEIAILNCTDDGLKISTTYSVSNHQPGYRHPVITMHQNIKGVFTETLELEDFPFDVQELTVQVSSQRPVEEVELIPDRCEMSTVDIHSCLDQDEWTLYQHVETSNRIRREEQTDRKEILKSCIDFTCSVKRNPGYYVWNIIFIMFIVTTLKFTAYSEVPLNFKARLVITFTLLLTCVAFKSTIKQSLPPISYLTYLDIYILISITLLAAQAIQMATMAVFKYNPDLMIRIDLYCLYVLGAIHFFVQAVLIVFMATVHYRRTKEMNRKDDEYMKQKQSLDSMTAMFARGRRSKERVNGNGEKHSGSSNRVGPNPHQGIV
ncbi:uncharacterized protein LOC141900104 [Tubulanus polymorphus]|uniref:uncharacterized protein LOC141900104 n=1 Tax=Tubulanus polymorphus TaxID=672921 RepID=UPI003DA69771